MQFDKRLYHAVLRTDFRAFLDKVFRVLAPGQTYVPITCLAAGARPARRV
jgi:hypothetical protein